MGRPTALGALALVALGGGGVQLLRHVRQEQTQVSTLLLVTPATSNTQEFLRLARMPIPPAPVPLIPSAPAPYAPPAPIAPPAPVFGTQSWNGVDSPTASDTNYQQKLRAASVSALADKIATESAHSAPTAPASQLEALLWPRTPRQPAPWVPCYCLAEGGHPVRMTDFSTLSRSQKFDDAYIRGEQQPLGPRTPWVRCSHSASCLARPDLSPARNPAACKDFRLRTRGQAAPAVIGVGDMLTLEVYGHTIHGEECRPHGDYFQVWLSGPGALSVSAVGMPSEDGTFVTRLMQPGTWAAYGMWMLDGASKSIILYSSKNGLWYGNGVVHDPYGKSKASWEAQARRDSLGSAKDTTLVEWQDKQLLKQANGELMKLSVEPSTSMPVGGTGGGATKDSPCTIDQLYQASSSGAMDMKSMSWVPNSCALPKIIDGSGISYDARIMIIGDAAALRAFELLKNSVGECRAVLVMKSQSEKYPNADLGLPASSAAHFKCARGIQLWFHGFSVAGQSSARAGFDARRRVDQFDFSYLGATVLDLVLLGIGKDFLIYDQDKFGRLLDAFLPVVKANIPAGREFWFMSQNRMCGPCASNGKGYSKGNKPVYLRELQNQARADGMNDVALAKAEQHGWRPLNQYAMSSAIPVTKQDNSWGLAQRDYMYVVQHITHYLPMTMRGEGQ